MPSTYSNRQNADKVRSEIERRGEYCSILEAQVGHSHPALVQLVKQCLENVTDERPTSEETLEKLKEIKLEEENDGGMMKHIDIGKVMLDH